MFSGKTEALIRRLRRFRDEGRRLGAAKPSIDDRSPSHWLVSHVGSRYPAHAISDPHALLEFAEDLEVIGVDEIQFFDTALVPIVTELRGAGVCVVAAGLDLDFRREPFESTQEIGLIADKVETLAAVCERCGRPATLTQRLFAGRPASLADDQIRIGGHDLYEARCEACYLAEERFRPQAVKG